MIYVTFSCLYISCVSFLLLWCGRWMRKLCRCGVLNVMLFLLCCLLCSCSVVCGILLLFCTLILWFRTLLL